jgi:hypothetical protein
MQPGLFCSIALFALSSAIFFSECDGYLTGSMPLEYGFAKSNVLCSPFAFTSLKTRTTVVKLTPVCKTARNVKRSSLSIRMSDNDDNGEEESFMQKTLNVLSTPITLPIPAFIASLVLGGVTISAGIFYSVYLMITVPDVSASIQTTVPDSTSASTITKEELSEGQRDSIIFNEILSGIDIRLISTTV